MARGEQDLNLSSDEDDALALQQENARLLQENARLRAALHELELRFKDVDGRKSEFISTLAHEMKGPMTTITGFGQALAEHWETISEERRARMLTVIGDEMNRLSRFVNDMLNVSRLETGTMRYDLKPTSLGELAADLLNVHTVLRERHEIVLDVPADLPEVMADPDKLRQVLLNLVTNACRYSPPQTKVEVRAAPAEDGPEVVVSVSDEGIGIPPEDQERIFTKFVVLDNPNWDSRGTGLGLYIVKEMIESHGGRVWCESEPSVGSTFYFTLPIADRSSAAPS